MGAVAAAVPRKHPVAGTGQQSETGHPAKCKQYRQAGGQVSETTKNYNTGHPYWAIQQYSGKCGMELPTEGPVKREAEHGDDNDW